MITGDRWAVQKQRRRTLVKSASYTDMTRVMLRALVLLLAVTSGACAARGAVPRPFPGAPLPPSTSDGPTQRVETPADPATAVPAEAAAASPDDIGSVVRTALELLGVPYRNGGSDPSGFDCSGFVRWVFAQHGLALPRDVRSQYEVGHTIDLVEVVEGDLLFFETVASGASHVGIALGNGRFVHAPSSKGVVRVEPYTASYWAQRFVGARRVGERVEEVEEVEKVEKVKEAVRPRVFPGSIPSAH
jgi:cell wall-associated NlpC family hydrolase